MNDEIYQVVAPGIQTVEIIVQAKAKVCQGPVKAFAPNALKSAFNAFPIQGIQVYIDVFCDIGIVIKKPGPSKAVSVDN